MNNFEMYQLSTWSEGGITKHPTPVVKSRVIKVKNSAKKALVGVSLFASSFMIANEINLDVNQSIRSLVFQKSAIVNSRVASNEFVEAGFWPKLIDSMSNWKSVTSISTEHDPEPLF